MRPDAFSTCHPVVTFAFFASVIVLCVIVQQPALQAVGLVGAAIYHLVLRGRDAWRLLVGLALAFVILAAVNPLFCSPTCMVVPTRSRRSPTVRRRPACS